MSDNQQNYVCRLTPAGRGALATLAVRGPRAVEITDSLIIATGKRRLRDREENHILFGHWQRVDGEEVVVSRRNPRTVEIHCHGGPVAVQAIAATLCAAGCEEVTWHQWLRASGAETIQVAAQCALAKATTQRTAMILLDQYHGALGRGIDAICGQLQRQDSGVAAALDRLLSFAPLGLHLTRPWRVVLGGPPNAGKSSLINAMVGYQRAIVFDRPGTTRDAVTATTAIDGWPVEMTDTAGLRVTGEAVESAGIQAALRALTAADLQIMVFDRSQPWSAAERGTLEAWPNAIVVHNKSDLPPHGTALPEGIETSAVTDPGVGPLLEEIARRLVETIPPDKAAVPFTEGQVAALTAAQAAATEGDWATAQDLMASLSLA